MLSKAAIKFCETHAVRILERGDFPDLLKEIHDPPERLFIQGEVKTLFTECFGIVGTRKPSSYGIRSTIQLSKNLSEAGVCIVSGLARGIDSASHRGALLGGGKTIAVLAHGHDEIYPRENRGLTEEILQNKGAIISEYSPFTGIEKHHFIARNRIVAGLSKGVLVIEAHKKSGSLITANFANDFGRDVFVLPGPYDDFNFQGSHELIQTGAKLVQSVSDITQEYPDWEKCKINSAFSKELDFYKKMLTTEFTFQELFEVSLGQGFQPAHLLKKWMNNKLVAQISPQLYTWVS